MPCPGSSAVSTCHAPVMFNLQVLDVAGAAADAIEHPQPPLRGLILLVERRLEVVQQIELPGVDHRSITLEVSPLRVWRWPWTYPVLGATPHTYLRSP